MTHNPKKWSGLAALSCLLIGLVLSSCSGGGGGSTGGGGAICADCDSKQGACSSHQGVNCSAGRDKDGSVICNDGWRDSTVQYQCGS